MRLIPRRAVFWASQWSVHRIAGPSMVPTLRDGDFVLARAVRGPNRRRGVRPGDVVLTYRPLPAAPTPIIKRAVRREGEGWWLLSDNEFVTSDSREWGAVPDSMILARAVLRLRDPVRVARIPKKR